MKPQMKYADKRGSVCVVIQGSNERERGTVQVKDLILGAKLSSAPDRETYSPCRPRRRWRFRRRTSSPPCAWCSTGIADAPAGGENASRPAPKAASSA